VTDRPASLTPGQIGRAAVFLLVIAAASLTVTLQGWRSRAPVFDLLPHVENALGLVHSGTLPVHGDTGSYGSYKPPGTAWVMAPSLLIFADTRLSQYVGAAILHLVVLAGVFWLAWRHFGIACAYLSALLYGVSEHGLFLAASLWPNGRPDVLVALVVFTVLWVFRRDPRFLAVAVVLWGIGMYIDMAITPAFFILPVVWLYERPPVRVAPLVVAAVVLLLVWFPYLRFEAPRAFIDIRSQLLQQNIFPASYRQTWCDPLAVLRSVNDQGTRPGSEVTDPGSLDGRVITSGLGLGRSIAENGVSNFNVVAPIPGAAVAMLALTLAGLLVSGLPRSVDRASTGARSRLPRATIVIAIVVLVAAGLYAVSSPSLLGKVPLGALVPLSARRLLRLVVLGGAAALAAQAVAWAGQRLLARSGIAFQGAEAAARTRVLRVSLIVPWVILVVMAEPGKPERFWWLWPLQLVFLSGFVLAMLPRLGVPRWICRALAVVVVGVVLANGFLVSRLEAWAGAGWGGPDADEVQIADDLAPRIKSDGRREAAIGYQTFIYPFMATYNVTNPRYKVGAEFDFILKNRHGIENTDRCAEGVSAADEYRVVQRRPKEGEAEPREYFDVPRDERFRLVRVFDLYQVFKRD
jgi:dolichyl-phosphate-mannose-protein mannosyltransferase